METSLRGYGTKTTGHGETRQTRGHDWRNRQGPCEIKKTGDEVNRKQKCRVDTDKSKQIQRRRLDTNRQRNNQGNKTKTEWTKKGTDSTKKGTKN